MSEKKAQLVLITMEEWDEIEARLASVVALESRADRLEADCGSWGRIFADLKIDFESRLDALFSRTEFHEKSDGERCAEMRALEARVESYCDEIGARLDTLQSRLDRIETADGADMAALEARVEKLGAKITLVRDEGGVNRGILKDHIEKHAVILDQIWAEIKGLDKNLLQATALESRLEALEGGLNKLADYAYECDAAILKRLEALEAGLSNHEQFDHMPPPTPPPTAEEGERCKKCGGRMFEMESLPDFKCIECGWRVPREAYKPPEGGKEGGGE